LSSSKFLGAVKRIGCVETTVPSEDVTVAVRMLLVIVAVWVLFVIVAVWVLFVIVAVWVLFEEAPTACGCCVEFFLQLQNPWCSYDPPA
jgi:hypothetical protein